MKTLQLSLKQKWFEMTKSGEKTEDYREITPYFCARFLLVNGQRKKESYWAMIFEFYSHIEPHVIITSPDVWGILIISFVPFSQNAMTLGYPKRSDTDKIITLEHKGIETGEGNPDWGAEAGKIYFVIKHGLIINE